MKKLVLFLAIATFALGLSAQPTNIIKTNPIGLAFGNFNATYEKTLGSSASILIKGQYMYKLFGLDVNLAGGGLGFRYYFTHAKKAIPSGFYINPQAVFMYGGITDEYDGTTYSATTLGFGAELGYQWVWESGFTLDLGLGPSYTRASGNNGGEGVSGILPSATIAIGFAF